jgi:hypothetical protein
MVTKMWQEAHQFLLRVNPPGTTDLVAEEESFDARPSSTIQSAEPELNMWSFVDFSCIYQRCIK